MRLQIPQSGSIDVPNVSWRAEHLLPQTSKQSKWPGGINEQKTQQQNNTSVVACRNLTSVLFESRHHLRGKWIMALGQTKVLIMHRKLSKDKLLHTEQLQWRKSGIWCLSRGQSDRSRGRGRWELSWLTRPRTNFTNVWKEEKSVQISFSRLQRAFQYTGVTFYTPFLTTNTQTHVRTHNATHCANMRLNGLSR